MEEGRAWLELTAGQWYPFMKSLFLVREGIWKHRGPFMFRGHLQSVHVQQDVGSRAHLVFLYSASSSFHLPACLLIGIIDITSPW